jgi:hypothetical protein
MTPRLLCNIESDVISHAYFKQSFADSKLIQPFSIFIRLSINIPLLQSFIRFNILSNARWF